MSFHILLKFLKHCLKTPFLVIKKKKQTNKKNHLSIFAHLHLNNFSFFIANLPKWPTKPSRHLSARFFFRVKSGDSCYCKPQAGPPTCPQEFTGTTWMPHLSSEALALCVWALTYLPPWRREAPNPPSLRNASLPWKQEFLITRMICPHLAKQSQNPLPFERENIDILTCLHRNEKFFSRLRIQYGDKSEPISPQRLHKEKKG